MRTPMVEGLPLATRMLLASDGSTTFLLEAMLGRSLDIRVLDQRYRPADRLPEHVRTALGVPRDAVLLDRHSQLVDALGAVVSVNQVVTRWPADGVTGTIVTSGSEPIGRAMKRAGVTQHRRLLDSGLAAWELGPTSVACAFKKYLISRDTGSPVYVHEIFNPGFVPVAVATAVAPGTAS